jgi:hypothetical protein
MKAGAAGCVWMIIADGNCLPHTRPVILSAQDICENAERQPARRISTPVGDTFLLWQRFFGVYSWRANRKFKQPASE